MVFLRMKRWAALLTVMVVGIGGCHAKAPESRGGKSGPRPVLVTFAPVKQQDVPLQVKSAGTVEAHATVAVRAMVGGELQQVFFQQGQAVKKGDPLFQLDARSLQAALRLAEANQAKNAAQLRYARSQFARYQGLYEQGGVSREQYEQLRANLAALEAMRDADSAAVENARLQVAYCSIKAPMSGLTGPLLVHPGNLVKANDTTPLVTINTFSPCYVSFTLPQQSLASLQQYRSQGGLPVEARLAGKSEGIATGKLSFVDNQIDPTTGTLKLKATFENSDLKLWPGQFVDVLLTLTTQASATVVPAVAVQNGQKGTQVYVARPDETAELRPVVAARSWQDLVVIESGLRPGEHVVTDGFLQLRPGAALKVAGRGGKKPEGGKPAMEKRQR